MKQKLFNVDGRCRNVGFMYSEQNESEIFFIPSMIID